jgi:hypothetical protein
MKLQDKFKLGNYISSKTDEPFIWSHNDCNTFFIEFHDMMYGTDDLKRIKDKYHDRRAAIKFQKTMVSPAQWLHLKGYEKISAPYNWQDGDVAVNQHKYYASGFIYFDGAFWTVVEGKTLTGYAPEAMEPHITNGWRKIGAQIDTNKSNKKAVKEEVDIAIEESVEFIIEDQED